MKKYLFRNINYFLHGADYNPEQWKNCSDILKKDMELFKEANLNEMSVAIFAFDQLEPEEGIFDFSFLDKEIEEIGKNGGKVLLATPSGAKPRWMAEKYPEICRVNNNLEREHYGGRHNHCYSSKIYREKVKEIDSLLAKRYANNPTVIGWHISNEFGGYCYCPTCQEEFRKWLKEKYHNNIDELNEAYWSTFWSHNYQNFEQIKAPSNKDDNCLLGLNLDWRRFSSLKAKEFMEEEIKIVKEANPSLPVTTNFMWDFYDYDYFSWGNSLDYISWDAYPDWHDGNNFHVANQTAFWHDLFRSIKKQPFVLMESAPGLVNWKPINKLKPQGLDVLSSIQAVAHGADSVQYFQFRKGRGSIEKFHGAVVDHVGTNNTRIFNNVKETGKILKKISAICGSNVNSKVAILFDWNNRWALDNSFFLNKEKGYIDLCYQYHNQCFKRGINCDIVTPASDLSKYSLVIAPMLYMVNKDTELNLENYVSNGGTLYASYCLGMVDESDLVHLGGFPCGKLKDVFGIWNEEIDSLFDNEKYLINYNQSHYEGKKYAEQIHLNNAKSLAKYNATNNPCLTVNQYKNGKAYYQAFHVIEDDILDQIFDNIFLELNISNPLNTSQLENGLSISTRVDDDKKYIFVQNFSNLKTNKISLNKEYLDLLKNENIKDLQLNPYDFVVLVDNNL